MSFPRVKSPELWPESLVQWVQRRITGDDGARKLPVTRMLHEFRPQRILVNVVADPDKRVSLSIILFQHMIVRLMLKLQRREFRPEVSPQKYHGVALMGIQTQAHPDQMQMIRHQAVSRAEQPFAGGGMKHHFAKRSMKCFVQPARATAGNGERPVDHGVALIVFTRETRQIERSIEIHFLHGEGETVCRASANGERFVTIA